MMDINYEQYKYYTNKVKELLGDDYELDVELIKENKVFAKCSDSELELFLAISLDIEDYEYCALIKEELDKRSN